MAAMAEPPATPGLALLGLALALLLAGAAVGHGGYLFRRWPGADPERVRSGTAGAALLLAAAGGASAVAAAVSHLTACRQVRPGTACARSAVVAEFQAPTAGAPALDLAVRMDGLAALFVAVVGFCAAAIAVYSLGWLRDDPLRHHVAGSFNLFVAATLVVLLVDNVFWLLVGLELLTLSSADLVRYRGRSGGPPAASRTAVRTYLMVSHVSLMFLLAGLLPVVVDAGSLDFDALRAAGTSPVPGVSFALVLLGLAIRAGVTPFHFWVPTVHPQMPTNTHAMMSAVMLKLPVYLMIRFFFEGMIGEVSWWWGAVLLMLAGTTALVTVFYALLSEDLKVALAYHSVENLGIILAGVGLALLFSDGRFQPYPAIRGAGALALLAALYHVVNHALFKTLLFLGAGSIEKRTGTVKTAALGGLLRRAPWTGVTFLVGAVAIAGLPPLNGFVSEWLTLQSLFGGQGVYRTEAPVALISMVVLATTLIALAMAFALTALAFVKITGEALLGEPRRAITPGRSAWSMRAVLGLLALACLALGLQPWLLVPWLSTAVAPLQEDLPVLHAGPAALTVSLPVGPRDVGSYLAELPMLPLFLLGALPVLLTALLWVRGWLRRKVWVGGEPFQPQLMQYPGSAVSALLWEPIGRQGAATSHAPLPDVVRLSSRRTMMELTNRLYNGLVTGITAGSQWLGDRIQDGDIRRYLLFMFAAVVLVLAALAVSR
jgi:formate hydrogenlyase subunit 3/multisubunit Na+/H+ antiporter MnhD subunit